MSEARIIIFADRITQGCVHCAAGCFQIRGKEAKYLEASSLLGLAKSLSARSADSISLQSVETRTGYLSTWQNYGSWGYPAV